MVVLLPAHRAAQDFPFRARSSAKDVHGRFRLLYLHGAGRLASRRPFLLLWICDSLGGPVDGKPDSSSPAAEFRQRVDSSTSGTHLQDDIRSVCAKLLHHWLHLRARSVPVGVGTLRHDGNYQPLFLCGGAILFFPLPETSPYRASGDRAGILGSFDRFPNELPSRGSGKRCSPADYGFLSTFACNMAQSPRCPSPRISHGEARFRSSLNKYRHDVAPAWGV